MGSPRSYIVRRVATIQITPRTPIVMALLRRSPLRVTIDDGEEQQIPWQKTTELSVAAGTHTVHMYTPWALPHKMGPADVELSLEDGETVEIGYKPPWIRTQPGRVAVGSAGT
jgi:hypothetical protein